MKQIKTLILWFILLLASKYAIIAQCAISGQLSDSLKAPIVFNAIGLLNANDSSIVKGVMTDDQGAFVLKILKKEAYQLKISAIGFKTYYSNVIEYDSHYSN
jgi:hypothetical protein